LAIRNILGKDDPLLRKKSRRVKKLDERTRILIEDMWDTMYAAYGVGLAAPQVGVLRRVVVIDTTPPEIEEDDAAETGGEGMVTGDETGAATGVGGAEGDACGGKDAADGAGMVTGDGAGAVAEADGAGGDGEADAFGDSGGGDENGGDDGGYEEEGIKLTLINPEIVERSEECNITAEGCLSIPGHVGRVSRPTWVRVKALDENGEEIEVYAEGYAARAVSHELDHLEGVLFTDVEEPPEEEEEEV
jgi:peptide deformylase